MSACPHCQKPLRNDWHFCPFCGVPAAAQAPSPNRPPVGHPLRDRRFFGDKPSEIVLYVKSSCPDHVVFVQNGYFWETYDDDARLCSSLFGWKVVGRGPHTEFTGVPVNAQRFKLRLREVGVSYVFVEQAEYPSRQPSIERVVGEVFSYPLSGNSEVADRAGVHAGTPVPSPPAPIPPVAAATAGTCLTCGDAISEARLALYPNARICVPCLDAAPNPPDRTCRRCGKAISDSAQSHGRWGCTGCNRYDG